MVGWGPVIGLFALYCYSLVESVFGLENDWFLQFVLAYTRAIFISNLVHLFERLPDTYTASLLREFIVII